MNADVRITIEDLIRRGTTGALRQVRGLIDRHRAPAMPWPLYREWGKKVSRLPASEASRTAWELFQQALREAEAAGAPRHTIRTQMGDMLYRQNKYRTAMQTYLLAFLEAPEPKPEYLHENLEKCFRRVDRAPEATLDRFLELARTEGPKGPSGIDATMCYLLTGREPVMQIKRRNGILRRRLPWLALGVAVLVVVVLLVILYAF
jgi:hypothetical protein